MLFSRRLTFSMLQPIAGASCLALVAGATVQARAQAFLSDITRWTAQDAIDPYAPGSVLFIGSSSIRRWEALTRDLNDYRIIQRGFGGALYDNVVFYVNDIVIPYAPEAVVVWAGTNDNTSGSPASEVFEDHQQFVAAVHAALPDTKIFYIGIMPTPSNTPFKAERDAINLAISNLADTDPRLFYIDIPAAFDALSPPSGPDFAALFVDPVHLNTSGYDLWTTLIRPALTANVTPNQPAFANPLAPATGESIFFDFGPSDGTNGSATTGPDANGNHWNNWYPINGGDRLIAGERVADLVKDDGSPSGCRLTIAGGFRVNGRVNGGLLNPNPALLGEFAVPTATEDYFFCTADDLNGGGSDDLPGSFLIEGLDPNLVYDFRFFASRTDASSPRVTEYTVVGDTVGVATLTAGGPNIGADNAYDGNDDEIAEVTGVVPDAFGKVWVDVRLLAGGFAYVNAMQISAGSIGVIEDPTDQLVDVGGTLAFSAEVSASGPGVALRWTRDGQPLTDGGGVTGATTDSLSIDGATPTDAGLYRLTAELDGTSVQSEPAIGGVRASNLPLDVNNDGQLAESDIQAFLEAVDAATGE